MIVKAASSGAEIAFSSDEPCVAVQPDINDQRVQDTVKVLQQHVSSQYGLPASQEESSGLPSSSNNQNAETQYDSFVCGVFGNVWLRLQRESNTQCDLRQHPRCYGPEHLLMQYRKIDGVQYFQYTMASGQQLRFLHSTVSKQDM